MIFTVQIKPMTIVLNTYSVIMVTYSAKRFDACARDVLEKHKFCL